MAKIIENAVLDHLTTFQVPARGRYLAAIESVDDLKVVREHPQFSDDRFLVLSGGSNILFSGDYAGLVLQMGIAGLEIVDETERAVWLKVGAGINWHELVVKAVDSGWYGIENLALIPGLAGAAPVQNIGAYGVELQDVFHELTAFDIRTGEVITYGREECGFGYRQSIFKQQPNLIVTAITIKLSKIPAVNISYGAIQDTLTYNDIDNPTPSDVLSTVIAIRRSKLPDPVKLGNAGSFFKNPVIPVSQADRIKGEYPAFPAYRAEEGRVKTSAAWLIEQSGWKGHRQGNCGVYEKHALVLVNYGGATGADILGLVKDVQNSVHDKFDISLEPEVRII